MASMRGIVVFVDVDDNVAVCMCKDLLPELDGQEEQW